MGRGKVISEKIRLLIIKFFNSGKPNSKIATLLDLSRYSVRNIVRRYKESGSVNIKPRYVKKSNITNADRRALRRIIEKNRRANYLQLSALWSDAVGRRISRSTTHREAHKLGFSTYKVNFLIKKIEVKILKLYNLFIGQRKATINSTAKEKSA